MPHDGDSQSGTQNEWRRNGPRRGRVERAGQPPDASATAGHRSPADTELTIYFPISVLGRVLRPGWRKKCRLQRIFRANHLACAIPGDQAPSRVRGSGIGAAAGGRPGRRGSSAVRSSRRRPSPRKIRRPRLRARISRRDRPSGASGQGPGCSCEVEEDGEDARRCRPSSRGCRSGRRTARRARGRGGRRPGTAASRSRRWAWRGS